MSDAEAQLGRADETEVFPDVTLVHYHAKGLSLKLESGLITSVLFYNGRAGGWNGHGFSRYEGPLPRGLDFDMQYDKVISILGKPSAEGDLSTAPTPSCWIAYPDDTSIDFVSKTRQIISISIEKLPSSE